MDMNKIRIEEYQVVEKGRVYSVLVFPKIEEEHLEEVVGENLFLVLGKNECLYNHYLIAKDLDEYCAGDDYGAWSAMGWIITQKGLQNMKQRAKETV